MNYRLNLIANRCVNAKKSSFDKVLKSIEDSISMIDDTDEGNSLDGVDNIELAQAAGWMVAPSNLGVGITASNQPERLKQVRGTDDN